MTDLELILLMQRVSLKRKQSFSIDQPAKKDSSKKVSLTCLDNTFTADSLEDCIAQLSRIYAERWLQYLEEDVDKYSPVLTLDDTVEQINYLSNYIKEKGGTYDKWRIIRANNEQYIFDEKLVDRQNDKWAFVSAKRDESAAIIEKHFLDKGVISTYNIDRAIRVVVFIYKPEKK